MATLPRVISEGAVALDANLAFLASAAAVELDNLYRGAEDTLEAVPTLAEILESLVLGISVSDPAKSSRSLLDPVAADVFGRALSSASANIEGIAQTDSEGHQLTAMPLDQGTTVESIQAGTRSIASVLAHVGSATDLSELDRLRRFCLSLSRSAQARVSQWDEVRPKNRYRR
jgi:hypothetical protein